MSKCEACGGDGQIEYGAYRGDESGPTRECKLCGGVITQTAPLETLGVSARSASGGLQRLAHSVSESGKRATDLLIATVVSPSGKSQTWTRETKPHDHSWKERVFADVVEYECECKEVAIFSRVNGSLINPVGISEIDKLSLSSRTMVRFPRYDKTPREVADKRLEQLRLENERRQAEAGSTAHVDEYYRKAKRGIIP